jgi:hypothetical protein
MNNITLDSAVIENCKKTSNHLRTLSVNTSTTTEKRFLTKNEREERREIQKQMLKKIREISIERTQELDRD